MTGRGSQRATELTQSCFGMAFRSPATIPAKIRRRRYPRSCLAQLAVAQLELFRSGELACRQQQILKLCPTPSLAFKELEPVPQFRATARFGGVPSEGLSNRLHSHTAETGNAQLRFFFLSLLVLGSGSSVGGSVTWRGITNLFGWEKSFSAPSFEMLSLSWPIH